MGPSVRKFSVIALLVLFLGSIGFYRYRTDGDGEVSGSGGPGEMRASNSPGPSGPSKSATLVRSPRLREAYEQIKNPKHGMTGAEFAAFEVKGVIELMGLKKELELTAQEAEFFTETYSDYQKIRVLVEQSRVRRLDTPGGALVFGIPAYPEEGLELRHLFRAELEAYFGAEKMRLLDEHLGQYMEEKFLGFGSFDQTYAVVESRDSRGQTVFDLKRSAGLPAGAGPPGTGPGGPVWIGGSSSASFDLEAMKSGDYSAIAPALTAYLAEGGQVPTAAPSR